MNLINFLDTIIINGVTFVEISQEAVPEIQPQSYYINIYGQVYNRITDRIIDQYLNRYGYYTVSIKLRTKLYRTCFVHRLMMMTFNYIPDYKYFVVDHLNGIKTDNRINNFEWVTPEENTRRAHKNGLTVMGQDCSWSKLNEEQVKQICELIASKQYKITDIANMYNVSVTTIGDIARGKQWKHISKNYNLDYDLRDRFSDQQVHIICKIIETYKPLGYSLEYIYYLILFHFGWPEERRIKKRISKIYYKDPRSYKYIWKQYNY